MSLGISGKQDGGKAVGQIRPLLLAATIAFVAALGFGMVGCQSASPEEIIREGISSELDKVKTQDDDMIKSFVEGMETTFDFSEYGIDSEEFARLYLDGFDYSIKDVKVTDSKAEAEVEIVARSAMSLYDDGFEAKVDEFVNSAAAQEMSQDEFLSEIGKLMTEQIKEAPLQTKTITLPFELKDNTWTPGSSFTSSLMSAFI